MLKDILAKHRLERWPQRRSDLPECFQEQWHRVVYFKHNWAAMFYDMESKLNDTERMVIYLFRKHYESFVIFHTLIEFILTIQAMNVIIAKWRLECDESYDWQKFENRSQRYF